jgi:4-hydroxybenzoate polyprenyltransferase
MNSRVAKAMSLLRTLWVISRPAGLPTVWSNCLAGWWLGGHQNSNALPLVLVSATLLYLGGGLLNDVFNAEFDKAHHPERPLPSGVISWKVVWRCGLVLLALGALLLFGAGTFTASLGLCLVVCIVLFNALHRVTPWSSVLLGMCRLFVYLLGASISEHSLAGWPVWGGIAVAAYVCGVALFRPQNLWPIILLACPVALAVVMDAGPYREGGLLLSAVFVLWTLMSFRQSLWAQEPNLPKTMSGLLAGIVLVDWVAVADAPRAFSFIFLALFGTSLILRKRPACSRGL